MHQNLSIHIDIKAETLIFLTVMLHENLTAQLDYELKERFRQFDLNVRN
jgi:hypothetical protein